MERKKNVFHEMGTHSFLFGLIMQLYLQSE